MTTQHLHMPNLFDRRLLSKKQVANKFGYSSPSWLDKHRATLEKIGFPPPILGPGLGSDLRWDERAIDLWLDSKIDDKLWAGQTNAPLKIQKMDISSIEKTLSQRAERLSL